MRTFHRRGPLWLVPLLILDFFAGLVAEQVVDARSKVTCPIFECGECRRQMRKMRAWAVVVWVAFVCMTGLALSNDALVIPAMILLVAAPVASFALPRRAVVQGWVTRDQQGIILSPVASGFVAAMQPSVA